MYLDSLQFLILVLQIGLEFSPRFYWSSNPVLSEGVTLGSRTEAVLASLVLLCHTGPCYIHQTSESRRGNRVMGEFIAEPHLFWLMNLLRPFLSCPVTACKLWLQVECNFAKFSNCRLIIILHVIFFPLLRFHFKKWGMKQISTPLLDASVVLPWLHFWQAFPLILPSPPDLLDLTMSYMAWF